MLIAHGQQWPALLSSGVGAGAGAPLSDKELLYEKASPISLAKAVKNASELAGMHEAHLRDSVPLAQTLHWLEQEVCPQSYVKHVRQGAAAREGLPH